MLAQLLSAAINVVERDRILTRGFGLQPAQRIADVVTLLDGLGPAERERLVVVFGVPPLVLSLHDTPVIADAAVAKGRGALFAARLRAALGDERVARVEIRPGFAAGPGTSGGARRRAEMMGPERPRRTVGGPVLRTEVQLLDGRWAQATVWTVLLVGSAIALLKLMRSMWRDSEAAVDGDAKGG